MKFPDGTDVEQRIEILAPQIQRLGLEYDTVAKRKRDLGTALENLYRFLNLVGFVSLLLGAVGVASAIQAHLQQKTKTGAILRCLGMSSRGTVFVYLFKPRPWAWWARPPARLSVWPCSASSRAF